jgi:hypothetical protein
MAITQMHHHRHCRNILHSHVHCLVGCLSERWTESNEDRLNDLNDFRAFMREGLNRKRYEGVNQKE